MSVDPQDETLPNPKDELVHSHHTPIGGDNRDVLDLVIRPSYYYISKYPFKKRQELLSHLHTIFKKETSSRILLELVATKAATGRALMNRLELNKQTFYSAIRWLIENDLIVKAAPLGRSRGRRAAIYAIHGYAPEDLAMAITEDTFLGTPGFKEIRRLADVVANGYIEYLRKPRNPEFLSRERLYEVLKKECRGFRWFDLKNDIEHELRCRGFKVA